MPASDDPDKTHIHAARSLILRDVSDLEEASALLGRDEQLLALFPSNLTRETMDSLTARLIELASNAGATVSAVQVGAVGEGPRKWRKWIRKLKWSRTLIVTPKDLSDPSVVVAWLPEAETGIERLMVGEPISGQVDFVEMNAADFDELRGRRPAERTQDDQ